MAIQISEFHIKVYVASSDVNKGYVSTGAGYHTSSTYPCSTTERYLSRFNIVAVANTNYHFKDWTYSVSWGHTPPSGSSASAVFGDTKLSSTTVLGKAIWTEPSTPYSDEQEVVINVKANFEANPSYTVSAKSNDTNKGTVAPSGGTYYVGTSLTFTATAKNGYHFVKWSWETSSNPLNESTANPLNFTVPSQAVSIVGSFTANTYKITLNQNGGSGGTASTTATYNSKMPTLEKVPKRDGYTFNGYFDKESGGNQYYKSDGTSAKTWDKYDKANGSTYTLYAHWTVKKYTIAVVPSPEGYGTCSGGGEYAYGTEITIKATANTCYKFSNWYDNNTNATRTVKVTENKTYSALFVKDPDYSFGKFRTKLKVRVNPNQTSLGTAKLYKADGETVVTQLISADYGKIKWKITGNDNDNGEPRAVQGYVQASANPGYKFTGWTEVKSNTLDDISGTSVSWDIDSYTSTAEKPFIRAYATMFGAPLTSDEVLAGSTYDNSSSNFAVLTMQANFESLPKTLSLKLTNQNPTYGVAKVKIGADDEVEVNSNSTQTIMFAPNATIILTAVPNTGYRFVKWVINNTTQTRSTYQFNTNANQTVSVYFELDPEYIYKDGQDNATYYNNITPFVSQEQSGWGTVSVVSRQYQMSSGNYTNVKQYYNITNAGIESNFICYFKATPTPGYDFLHWLYAPSNSPTLGLNPEHNTWSSSSYATLSIYDAYSNDTGATATVKFAGSTDKINSPNQYNKTEEVNFKIQAVFSEHTKYGLTTSRNNWRLGNTPTGGGEYPYGAEVTVKASPKNGAVVNYWQLITDGATVLKKYTPTGSDDGKTWTFTMPQKDCTAKVYYRPQWLGKYRLKFSVSSGDPSKGQVEGETGPYYTDYEYITIAGAYNDEGVAEVPTKATNTITVKPKNGYIFDRWEDVLVSHPEWVDPTSSSSPKSSYGVVSSDIQFMPGSTQGTCYLTGSADVVGIWDQYYSSKEEVELNAVARFVAWSSDVPPYNVNVTITAGTGGSITSKTSVQSDGYQEIGQQASISDYPIKCTASNGYHFVNWTQSNPVYSLPDGVGSGSTTSSSTSIANSTSTETTATTTILWKKKASYTYDPNTPLHVDVTLTANFAGNTYTATLDKNGGSGGVSSVTATYGSAMPALSSNQLPTKSGYAFLGYFDSNNTKYYNVDGTSAKAWNKTSNTTLYAQWSKVGIPVKVWNGTDWQVCAGIKVCTSFSNGNPVWQFGTIRKATADGGSWSPSE